MKTFSLELSLSTITELINNSENPTVALQLIEGTYTEPVIPSSVYDSKRESTLSFISFNKWNNKVEFSFLRHKYYTEEGNDYAWTKSEKYCIKKSSEISNNSMPLTEWICFFNEMKDSIDAL